MGVTHKKKGIFVCQTKQTCPFLKEAKKKKMISENLVVINFLAVVWSMFLIVLSMHFQCAPTALPKHDYHTRALRRLRFRRARTAFSKRKSHARTFRRWRAQATSLRVVKGLRRSRLRHRTSNIAQATVRDWILNFPRDVCGGFDAPLATSQDGGVGGSTRYMII